MSCPCIDAAFAIAAVGVIQTGHGLLLLLLPLVVLVVAVAIALVVVTPLCWPVLSLAVGVLLPLRLSISHGDVAIVVAVACYVLHRSFHAACCLLFA